jgi:tetratricopeptide (TPR) repeat protein
MAKVYVSSTIADLGPERQAVLDWLRAARHQAIDSYLPDSDTVRESCLDDVGKCDLYVLILGHRYGFVPPDDNPGGLSITQLEFRRAGQCGIPRIALVRTSIPDERLSDLQDPARAALVWAFRAEVAREVRPAEFSDLKGLVQGLSTGIQNELDKLAERPADQVAAGRVLRLPPRPVFLAGREELLTELKDRLAADDDGGPRVVALCGMGGAGKTSVALEYAYRHLTELGLVWQLPAGDPTAMAAAFGELAALLGVRDLVAGGNPVPAVHAVLADRPGGWLLIFDNATDAAAVAGGLPPAGDGQVIITSQNPEWPGDQAVEVPVLNVDTTAKFMMARTGDPDEQSARLLAGELGGLPLALEQAAAYMRATGRDIAGYLALYEEGRAGLLARGDPAGYDKRVTTTWSLAFAQLEEHAPAAVGLLRLLACCAPDAIPYGLLLQPHPGLLGLLSPEAGPAVAPLLDDPLAVDDAVVALRRYSLISPPVSGVVSVHRLVQDIVRWRLDDQARAGWAGAAVELVACAFPSSIDELADPNQWRCAQLLAHALVATEHAQVARVAEATAGDLLRRAGSYLDLRGEYQAARGLLERSLDLVEAAHGRDHIEVAKVLNALGHVLWEQGELAAARGVHKRALTINEAHLSPGHQDIGSTLNNLGHVLYLQDDLPGAHSYLERALTISRAALGPDDPEVASTLNNLGEVRRLEGDLPGARKAHQRALEIKEAAFGRDSPRLGYTLNYLGVVLRDLGDLPTAKNTHQRALDIFKAAGLSNHPDLAANLDNLGVVLRDLGELPAAKDAHLQALAIFEARLPPNHPDVIASREHLMAVLRALAEQPDGSAKPLGDATA